MPGQHEPTASDRYQVLLDFCRGLVDPANNSARLEQARHYFAAATPQETMRIVDTLVQEFPGIGQLKIVVTRLLNAFSKGLNAWQWDREKAVQRFAFIRRMIEHNAGFVGALEQLRPAALGINGELGTSILEEPLERLLTLSGWYVSLQNLLFPLIEHYVPDYRCVQLMWAIHDDVRNTIAEAIELAKRNPTAKQPQAVPMLNALIGRIFFDIRSLVFREEQVLLPAIITRIPASAWDSLDSGQYETGQVQIAATAETSTDNSDSHAGIDLGTGSPTAAQLIALFNNLPVDITLVDAQDKVVYFNTPSQRIFPRTAAVVGRTVQNCHPPKSMHMVQRILDAFRCGDRDQAEFRIDLHGTFVVIRYIALRDAQGVYQGTLEVSQDITHLRDLEGERRLLDWT